MLVRTGGGAPLIETLISRTNCSPTGATYRYLGRQMRVKREAFVFRCSTRPLRLRSVRQLDYRLLMSPDSTKVF